MLTSTKIKLQMSQSRERLAVLSAMDEPGEAETNEMGELTTSYTGLEKRYQAAVLSEGDKETVEDITETEPDGEAKELFGLVCRSKIGNYLERSVSGRPLDGAEAELNRGLKLAGGDRMPIHMLLDPVDQDHGELEERADTATNLTVNTVQRPEMWLKRVFVGTASEHLGVTRKSVSGLAAFPVIGSGVTAGTVTKTTAKDAESFGLTVETLDPKRLSARYLFSKEDAARLGPATFEENLRTDLRMSMASQMDDEIINGAGSIFDGLAGETALTITGAADAAIADATTGLQFAQGLLGLIDGKYAMMSGDIRYIAAANLYAHLKTLSLAVGTTDSVYVSAWLDQIEGVKGMASGHIAEITGASGESYVYVSLAKGMNGAACHAVWDSVEIIRDPYSNAETGQVALTLTALHNFIVLRSANYLKRRVART